MEHSQTTLYLADDHQIVIDGLRLLISSALEFKILGSAIDGNTAHKEISIKKPDIAIVDFRMPGMTGIDLINSLRKQVHTKFIILSMHNDRRYIIDSINYGAAGYLLKSCGKNELLNCIQRVSVGEKYFPTEMTNRFSDNRNIFTPRESEILKMIINEFTTQDIADNLSLSHYTVETHRKNICRKAKTRTIVGLLKYISENSIEI